MVRVDPFASLKLLIGGSALGKTAQVLDVSRAIRLAAWRR